MLKIGEYTIKLWNKRCKFVFYIMHHKADHKTDMPIGLSFGVDILPEFTKTKNLFFYFTCLQKDLKEGETPPGFYWNCVIKKNGQI